MDQQNEISKELLLDVLETLTKMRRAFPYTVLLYALEPKQVMTLLDVCQGTTITFPTQEELMRCVTFTLVQKYGSYDATPKELLNGLTRKQYNDILQAINSSN